MPCFVVAAILATAFDFDGVGQTASIVLDLSGAAGRSAEVRRVFCRVKLRLLLQIHVDRVLILTQPADVTFLVIDGCGRGTFGAILTLQLKGLVGLDVYHGRLPLFALAAASHRW